MAFALEPIADPGAVAARWRALETRAAPSFFQSWDWIGPWLGCLPPERAPVLAVGRSRADDRVVGLGVLVFGRRRRFGLQSLRTAYLNDSSVAAERVPTVECNGLLSDPAAPPELAAAFVDWVLAAHADELVVAGLDGPLPADATLIGRCVAEPAPYVDLDALRRRGVAYIETLSANTRYQVRRAQRDYAADGALVLRSAESRAEAHDFLARLADLHQRHWTARGRPGAFASPFFARFHDAVVEAGFDQGAIQLLRVTAGPGEIGYLYNLVYGRRIAAYQSGFAYQPDNRLKPGLVSHALAIEHNLAAGAARYDFLAGVNQMKQSLATHCETLNWVSLRRPRFGALLEDRARYLKSFLNKSNGR